MQPTESLAVPRRPLDVEDYIDILRRHKGWIFGPFLLTLVSSVVGVFLWPDSYRSQAVIQITPQQVPENMAPSVLQQSMTARINQMATEILSGNQLTTIIRNMDLYKREVNSMAIYDVAQKMRDAIDIDPVRGFAVDGQDVPAFTISFTYSNRLDAQRVVMDLTGKFMEANQRVSNQFAYASSQFFLDERDRAKAALDEISNRITQFRLTNQGRLPDQLEGNVQRLNALNNQVTALFNSISRVNNEKLTLESNINILKDNLEALGKETQIIAATSPQKSPKLAQIDQEIEVMQRNLNDLLRTYTEKHPDVKTYRGRLENARAQREKILAEEAAAAAAAAAEDKPVLPLVNPQLARERRNIENNIAVQQTQIRNKEAEIADLNRQLKTTQDQINRLQQQIQAAPVGQQEYLALLREEALARDRYIKASENLARAETSKNVQERKQGENLQILDPANLPQKPTSPQRGLVISVGAAVGLLLGIVVAGVREVKDTSLKNLKDVRAYTQMAILGSVPLLENDFVVRRRKRIAWLGWTTACLLAVIIMTGSIVYYYSAV